MRSALLAALVVACSVQTSLAGAPVKGPAQTGDPLLDYRLRASRAESAYKEMRRSAEELVELSGSLSRQIGERGLTREDGKALDRIRKLAKRIRSDMGGMGDAKLESPPQTPRDAAEALGVRGAALAEQLERATRFEMNARMIAITGEMILLVDLLKQMGR